MFTRSAPPLVLALLAVPCVSAQQQQVQSTYIYNDNAKDQRPFALVSTDMIQTFQTSWNEDGPMQRYVHAHPGGHYVVFLSGDGKLHRLNSQERMAEIDRMYAPLRELSARQQALGKAQAPLARQQERLAHTQQPLAAQQQALGEQQRQATTPEDHGRIAGAQGVVGQEQGNLGEVQGAIGQEQGEIGALQGAIGRQQGELTRANSKRINAIFTQCLTDGSCPELGS